MLSELKAKTMSIPNVDMAISTLQKYFDITIYQRMRKKIFYEGDFPDGGKLLICTPQSKLHPKGNGWIDLTVKQITLLQEATYAIFALRIEGDKIYYFGFDNLKPLLTEDTLIYNNHEGDHWKLHVWPDCIKVLGNSQKLVITANRIDNLGSGRN